MTCAAKTAATRLTHQAGKRRNFQAQARSRMSSSDDGLGMLETRSVSRHFGGVAAVDAVSIERRAGRDRRADRPERRRQDHAVQSASPAALKPSRRRGPARTAPHRRPAPPHRRLARGLGRTFQIPRPVPADDACSRTCWPPREARPASASCANWLPAAAVRAQERRNVEQAMRLLDFVTLDEARARAGARPLRRPAQAARAGARPDGRPGARSCSTSRRRASTRACSRPSSTASPRSTRRGVTFLIIEHNMDLVARLCGRVLVMAAGPAALPKARRARCVRDPRVIDAYLGGAAA